MKMWVAKDKLGPLYMYDKKPVKWEEGEAFISSGKGKIGAIIDKELFKSVTYENSPKRIEIKLIK